MKEIGVKIERTLDALPEKTSIPQVREKKGAIPLPHHFSEIHSETISTALDGS